MASQWFSGVRMARRLVSLLGVVCVAASVSSQNLNIQWARAGGPAYVVMSPTGGGLRCGGLKMIDPSTGLIKWGVCLPPSDQYPLTPTFSPDGSRIAAVYNYQLNVWRASDGALLNTVGSGLETEAYSAWSPDGSHLALGSIDPGTACILYATSTWTTVGRFKSPDGTFIGCGQAAFSPDSSVVATGSYPYGRIAFWSALDGSFIKSGAIPDSYPEPYLTWISNSTLVFSGDATYSLDYGTLVYSKIYPSGRALVSTSFDRSLISLAYWAGLAYQDACLRASDFSVLWTSPVVLEGYCPAISPDDSRMILPYMLTVLNMSDFSVVGRWAAHRGYTAGVAETPSAQLVVSAGYDGKLMFWDQATGAPLYTSSSPNIINCLAVSPDSSMVATGPDYVSGVGSGQLTLWNVSDGSLLRSFGAFDRCVNSVAFSPDGQALFASGIDHSSGTVKAVRVADGSQLWTRLFNVATGGNMCISLDGSTIAVYDPGVPTQYTSLWLLKGSTGQVLWSAAAGSVHRD